MGDESDFDPDAVIALAYARRAVREGLSRLLVLDRFFAETALSRREPMLTQIRLAWWREQLERIDCTVVAADPMLETARWLVQRHDVSGDQLAALVNAWDTLIAGESDSGRAIELHAISRGRALAAIGAAIAKDAARDEVSALLSAWSARQCALRATDLAVADSAIEIATRLQGALPLTLMPASMRPLAILSRLAERDVMTAQESRPKPGSPRRMLQALGFVLFRH